MGTRDPDMGHLPGRAIDGKQRAPVLLELGAPVATLHRYCSMKFLWESAT